MGDHDRVKQPTQWRVIDKTCVDLDDQIFDCKLICGHTVRRKAPNHRFKFMECFKCQVEGQM